MRARGLVTAALLLAVLAVSSPASFAVEPAASIDPATDLVDGQRVTLTGSGLPSGRFIVVVQCASTLRALRECGNFNAPGDRVGADGSLTLDVFVDALLFTPQGQTDCREQDACVLVVDPEGAVDDSGASSIEVPLQFDPDAPLRPPPTATVDPDRDLVDGQVVTVAGSGFRPNQFVELVQCSPSPESFSGCAISNEFPTTDDQGTFTTPMTLTATLQGAGGEIDCRTVAPPCVVVASQGGFTAPNAARITLRFDPDAPLLPPPTIEVSPATDVEDGGTLTVRGSGFSPDADVRITLCATGESATAPEHCDEQGSSFANADAAGALTANMGVVADFSSFDGTRTDCRRAPECEVVALDFTRGRAARAPITFAPAPPPRGRFLDPVFDEVEVTRDVVYRDTIDYQGNPVQLHLDIYQPKGDTAAKRPVVIWMHGGNFIFGDKRSMASYAEEFARRGYVAISLQYRLRSGISATDAEAVVAAAHDAQDDASAGTAWLRSHADDYRIDRDAIASGGYSAGAVTSLNLAYFHDERGEPASPIDAAVSIAGVGFGHAQPGDPPSIMFHGTEDTTLPFAAGEGTCLNAQAAGVVCELVRYEGGTHGIVSQFERDIVRRTADFLGWHILGLGTPPAPVDPLPPPRSPPADVPRVVAVAMPAPVVAATPRYAG